MPIKKAMILAAGRGDRLRPLTDTTPKPLIKVGDRSLIEHHLLSLADSGILEVVINLSYLGEQIKEFLGNGEQYGLRIAYSIEPNGPLETAGGIQKALPLLGDSPFLVVNGDIRCPLDFQSLGLSSSMNMHLVTVSNPSHHPDGDFWLDDTVEPAKLVAADSAHSRCTKVTFSGIGIYRPALFHPLTPGVAPLAPLIHQQIATGRVSAELYSGYWADVGTADRLAEARAWESRL